MRSAAERVNSRNGYRDRLWETRTGSGDLKIPKLRQGTYFPGFGQLRVSGRGIDFRPT
jgi:transposase-like protein